MAPPDFPDDELPPSAPGDFASDEDVREGRYGFVPDFVKKVAVAGLGAIFMTEEGIRSLAGQLKLPKEVLGFILAQAEKTKGEVGRVMSEEIRRFLQSEKLREEFLKLMTGMTVELKAEIRLVPDKSKAAAVASTEDAPVVPPVVVSELRASRGRKKKE